MNSRNDATSQRGRMVLRKENDTGTCFTTTDLEQLTSDESCMIMETRKSMIGRNKKLLRCLNARRRGLEHHGLGRPTMQNKTNHEGKQVEEDSARIEVGR